MVLGGVSRKIIDNFDVKISDVQLNCSVRSYNTHVVVVYKYKMVNFFHISLQHISVYCNKGMTRIDFLWGSYPLDVLGEGVLDIFVILKTTTTTSKIFKCFFLIRTKIWFFLILPCVPPTLNEKRKNTLNNVNLYRIPFGFVYTWHDLLFKNTFYSIVPSSLFDFQVITSNIVYGAIGYLCKIITLKLVVPKMNTKLPEMIIKWSQNGISIPIWYFYLSNA